MGVGTRYLRSFPIQFSETDPRATPEGSAEISDFDFFVKNFSKKTEVAFHFFARSDSVSFLGRETAFLTSESLSRGQSAFFRGRRTIMYANVLRQPFFQSSMHFFGALTFVLAANHRIGVGRSITLVGVVNCDPTKIIRRGSRAHETV